MNHPIRKSEDEKDSEGQRRDVLLELDAPVHCEKGIVVATHATKEVAILDTGPATPSDGGDAMAFEHRGEVER